MTNTSVNESPISALSDGRLSQPEYTGGLGSLYRLIIVNLLTSVVTLGIYRFWGTTKVRRYLWQNLRLWGEPFEYTGTGGELCKSFCKAMGLLFLLMIPFSIIEALLPLRLRPLSVLLFYPLFFFAIGFAAFSARRYRLSRTLWRGLRFAQEGSPSAYAFLWLKTLFLTAVTLGLYAPYGAMRQHGYVWNRTYFGQQPFDFDGDGRDLFGTFVKAWLLALPTLGMSLLWYGVQELKYRAAKMRFGEVRFVWTPTFGQCFVFLLGNAAIVLFTLGLGQPVALTRSMRFFCAGLAVKGTPDFGQLQKGSHTPVRGGEGLLDLLDVDIA